MPSFEVVRKGFNREQVLVHLRLLGERVSELETRLDRAKRDLRSAQIELARTENERDEARRKADDLQARVDDPAAGDREPYAVSTHMMELAREFDRDVDLLRTKADLEAKRVVAEARTDAANRRIEAVGALKEARAKAERLLQEARDDAAEVRAQVAPLRELTISQAEALRDRMRTSLLELEALMAVRSGDEPVIVVGEAQEEQPDEAPNWHDRA